MKTCLVAILVFAAGITFGMVVRPYSVRAQGRATGNATVYVDELSGRDTSGKAVRGSTIVGFSCAEDGNGSIHCYAASVDR